MNPQNSSFKAFLSHIIDYAGTYPPANLPLGEAFNNFILYQSSPDAWMLSRFVVPAKRLCELQEFGSNLSFTVLGRGGRDLDEFLGNVNLDIDDILSFREARGSRANVDTYEASLPASTLADRFTANDAVTRSADALNKNGITIFFEAPFGEGWDERAEKLIRALRKVRDKHVGFKLRTGGVVAEAFPSPAQVAWAITEVRDSGVPMKCTAGLHHPLRHYDGSVQTEMHGFLNVFSAGILSMAVGIPPTQVQEILEDEDPSNFVFDETGFEWKGLRAPVSEIVSARGVVTSFGSCSFDEPREDLRNLGLM